MRTVRSILLAVLFLFPSVSVLAQDPTALARAADELYSNRAASCDKVLQAIERWQDALKLDPAKADVYWKIARAHHYLGRVCGKPPPDAEFQKGLDFARKALEKNPNGAGANYWFAASLMEMNEAKDAAAYLKMRSQIRRHLEKAKTADPGFENGGPDRLLGRLLLHSKIVVLDEAETHLRSALESAPDESASLVLLGELLIKRKAYQDAKNVLFRIDMLAPAQGNDKELAADQARARTLLASLPK